MATLTIPAASLQPGDIIDMEPLVERFHPENRPARTIAKLEYLEVEKIDLDADAMICTPSICLAVPALAPVRVVDRRAGEPWCAECGTAKGPFIYERETEVCVPCWTFHNEED